MYVQKSFFTESSIRIELFVPTVLKKFVQIFFRGKVINSNQAVSNLIHDVN